MKRLQKELSELRTRFEEYVGSRGSDLHSKHLPPPSAQKRKHEDESEDAAEGDSDAQPSSPKKQNVEGKNVDKSKFSVDSDEYLIVYTDGCCFMNGKHGAVAGVGVYFGSDHPL